MCPCRVLLAFLSAVIALFLTFKASKGISTLPDGKVDKVARAKVWPAIASLMCQPDRPSFSALLEHVFHIIGKVYALVLRLVPHITSPPCTLVDKLHCGSSCRNGCSTHRAFWWNASHFGTCTTWWWRLRVRLHQMPKRPHDELLSWSGALWLRAQVVMSSVGAFMSIVFFKNRTSDVRNQFALKGLYGYCPICASSPKLRLES